MLVIILLVFFAFLGMGLSNIVKISLRGYEDRKERSQEQMAEAFVMMTAAMHAGPAIDQQLTTAFDSGTLDLPSEQVAQELQLRLAAEVTNLAATEFRGPVDWTSLEVKYGALPVHSSDPARAAYANPAALALSAQPFRLAQPPGLLDAPYDYVDYVPPGHPLENMYVRRYPFTVSYVVNRRAAPVRRTRRLSIYQVPVAQFGRFSTGTASLDDANVTLADAEVFAFGGVSGSGAWTGRLSGAGGGTRRLWASQLSGISVDAAGSEAEQAFNLSSVQVQASRIGGRLVGEHWTLAAPHFFSARVGNEKVPGLSRPIPSLTQPTAKAYDAHTFIEVLYDASAVSDADVGRGPLHLNIFDQTGTLVTSVEGVMQGFGPGDSPAFNEHLIGADGSIAATRPNRLSVSPPLAGASESLTSLDFIALTPGAYAFSVDNPGGAEVVLFVDGVEAGRVHGSGALTVPMATGVRQIDLVRRGAGGTVTYYVTPPTLNRAYVSQWCMPPGADRQAYGSFASNFPGRSSFGWTLIPTGVVGNTTGIPFLVFILRLDQPWQFGRPEEASAYIEGVQVGGSRYVNAGGREWTPVLIEASGSSLHPTFLAKRATTFLTPNHVILAASTPASYRGLYFVTRGGSGDSNVVFCGFNQADRQTINVTGVVGGSTAAMPSYFDRAAPAVQSFTATGAQLGELNSVFKTLVLLDDFYVRETTP